MPLQTTHRPSVFETFIGNEDQIEALQIAIDREDFPHSFLCTGAPGTGKSQPLTSYIQTPNGPVLMRDVQMGMPIFSKDGAQSTVTGIFPQGVLPTYKITFRDKCCCYCSADHLWAIHTTKLRQTNKAYKIITTQEIMDTGVLTNSGKYRFSIPLIAPLQYEHKNYEVPPYTLGALLGDGTALGKTPTLVLSDSQIIKKVENELPAYVITSSSSDKFNKCRRYRITWPAKHNANPINAFFRKIKLDVKSPFRFIPKDYLYGSIQQRWELLRGLMDTDGSIRKNRVSFSTMSQQLANDIQILTQSLGGTAIISRYARKHKGVEYHVNIKTFENPFYIKNKADYWTFSHKNPPSRSIKDITYVGDMEHQCISVSAQDNLYLTDHHIVTHNTTLANVLKEHFKCSEMDFYYYNAANTRGIDTIRDISVNCHLAPMGGPIKIYVLDECHAQTSQAMESLLLLLENPPKDTIFILCTSEPEKLKLSVKRRCFQCNLLPLPTKDIISVLTNILKIEEVEDIPAEVIQEIAEACQGSAGMAVAMLDAVIDITDAPTQLSVVASMRGVNDSEGIEICRALSNKNWKQLQVLLSAFNGEPESLRYMILSYFTTILLGKNKAMYGKANEIILLFSESYIYTKKAGLISSCYMACQ